MSTDCGRIWVREQSRKRIAKPVPELDLVGRGRSQGRKVRDEKGEMCFPEKLQVVSKGWNLNKKGGKVLVRQIKCGSITG